jgi:hypothetical protein
MNKNMRGIFLVHSFVLHTIKIKAQSKHKTITIQKIHSKLFAHKIIIPWEKIATSPIHKASRNIRAAVVPSGESHHGPMPF